MEEEYSNLLDSWLRNCLVNALAATESSKNGIQKVIHLQEFTSPVGRKFYGAGEIEILGIHFPGILAFSR